ncbi:hypothetical protein KX729_32860, partial [Rhizobium sp. XQZ8]|nr:hypothetical protein [Rhizobium populisoli]
MLLPQFTIAEGDKLEISGFLGDMRDAVREDYIDLAYAWGKTFISVDRDGLGSKYQLELIAEIDGRVSEAELASSLSLFGETYNTDMNVVIGTVQADRIVGLSCADAITGLSGNDTLTGGAGGDILDGGAGNDALSGGADGDTLLGGAGTDKLDGGTEADVMRGGADNDTYI